MSLAEPGEDRRGAGPVRVQQGSRAGWWRRPWRSTWSSRMRTSACSSTGRGVERVEPAQPVAVGAQVVGQLVAVAGVGLRLRRRPSGAGWRGRRWGGSARPGGRLPAAGRRPDRGWPRSPPAARPGRRGRPGGATPRDPGFVVGQRPPVHHLAGVVDDGDVVGSLAQSHPMCMMSTLLFDGWWFTRRSRGPVAACSLFGPRSGMSSEGGHGASARQGRQYSRWPSSGTRAWPSPDGSRVATDPETPIATDHGAPMSERVFERANHQARSSAHWCTIPERNPSHIDRVHQ